MIWTIKLMFVVGLTSLTGTALLLTWYFIGKLLEHSGYLNIQYTLLKGTLCFFVIPIVYLVFMGSSLMRYQWGRGVLLLQTPVILMTSRIFCGLWFAGVVALIIMYLWNILKLAVRCSKNIPCIKTVQNLFDSVCEEMHIPVGRVRLRQNYHVFIPEFMGAIFPVVVIPCENYSEKELRVIFTHELTHYRQKDIWIKYVIIVITIVHCMNPAAWWLHFSIRKWSEYVCDSKAYKIAGGLRNYFNTIIEVVADREKASSFFTVQLTEKAGELEERVARVIRYKRFPKKTSRAAVLICSVLFAVSVASVYAAAAGSAMAYASLYHSSVIDEEEPLDEMELVEYVERPELCTSTVVLGEVSRQTRSVSNFEWTISSNMAKQTSLLYAYSGGSITMTIYVDPVNQYVNAGIIEPDGTRRYVRNKDYISHVFTLDQTGYYRVFVENKNKTSVKVEGSYRIQ